MTCFKEMDIDIKDKCRFEYRIHIGERLLGGRANWRH